MSDACQHKQYCCFEGQMSRTFVKVIKDDLQDQSMTVKMKMCSDSEIMLTA